MPANYAHYRFGKQLLSGMCPNDRRSIQRFRRLYDMGLHGPDIFFYYNPLIKTATGQLGGVFHAQSGQEFFARVCAQAGSEAGRVYLLGLLGHYCLDSLCHPYVEKTVALFYPPATPANVNTCVRNMARATRFLVGKNRKRVQRLLRLTRSPAIEDQLMPEQGSDRWLWMDSEMLVLYNRALKRYPGLLSQLDEHMRTGEPLGQDFAPAFG